MVEIFINNWIIIGLLGAIITSFNAPPEDKLEKNIGHYVSWMFLPIFLPIIIIISLIKMNYDLLNQYYNYLLKINNV